MTQISMDEKFKRAAEVICKQGMVQFPLSDTAIAIVVAVVGDNEEELDLIYAFRERPSQTADQLVESSGFAADKVEQLANSLAGKGLVFNQPSSTGVMPKPLRVPPEADSLQSIRWRRTCWTTSTRWPPRSPRH